MNFHYLLFGISPIQIYIEVTQLSVIYPTQCYCDFWMVHSLYHC